MLLIGAGQLAEYLARWPIQRLRGHVCDPREEYPRAWDVPGVTR